MQEFFFFVSSKENSSYIFFLYFKHVFSPFETNIHCLMALKQQIFKMSSGTVFWVNFSGFTGLLQIILIVNRSLKGFCVRSKRGKTGFIARL